MLFLFFGGLMNCINCQKKFYIKRDFLSLFETKKYYICDECRNDYPINLKLERIPLENAELFVVSLLDKSYHFNYNAYILELSLIITRFIKKYSNYHLVYLDNFKLSYFNLEVLSFLADSVKKSILLVCFNLKK